MAETCSYILGSFYVASVVNPVIYGEENKTEHNLLLAVNHNAYIYPDKFYSV